MQSLVDEFLSPELKSNGIELGAIAVFGPCNEASGNTRSNSRVSHLPVLYNSFDQRSLGLIEEEG